MLHPSANHPRDALVHSFLGADKNFLQALLRLRHSLEASGNLALDPDGAGAGALAEGFAAVGAADDDANHPIERLDLADRLLAFLRGGLMASA